MAGSESAKAQGCCTTRRSTTPARSATSFSIEAPSPTSQIPRRRQNWCRAEHAAWLEQDISAPGVDMIDGLFTAMTRNFNPGKIIAK
jgi:hypothetical protein